MIEIDQYRGDAEHLAEFVSLVWRESYAGLMTCPVWSAEYMRWHFPLEHPETRRRMLAAYDGDQLAGVLLGLPLDYRTPEHRIPGSLWSWLSIHPAYRGRHLAVRLDQARVELMKSLGSRLVVSYRFFGSRHSQAERPGHSLNRNKLFLRKLRFWSRVLDPVRFHRWDLKRFEGFLGLLSYPVAGIPDPGQWGAAIRPFRPSDLPMCLALLQRMTTNMSLAIDWSNATLQRQLLGSPLSRTLVYEEQGAVRGLVNFHLMPFLGRGIVEQIGIFDLFALEELPPGGRVALVNRALRELRDAGAILALTPSLGQIPLSTLLKTRWSPTRPETHLVLQWTGEPVPSKPDLPLQLLWR
ncbi:MAG: GNAT family N-acetyltransferase [Planctomycetaceae bacterium]